MSGDATLAAQLRRELEDARRRLREQGTDMQAEIDRLQRERDIAQRDAAGLRARVHEIGEWHSRLAAIIPRRSERWDDSLWLLVADHGELSAEVERLRALVPAEAPKAKSAPPAQEDPDTRSRWREPRVGDVWQSRRGLRETARVTHVETTSGGPLIALEWRGPAESVDWWLSHGWSAIHEPATLAEGRAGHPLASPPEDLPPIKPARVPVAVGQVRLQRGSGTRAAALWHVKRPGGIRDTWWIDDGVRAMVETDSVIERWQLVSKPPEVAEPAHGDERDPVADPRVGDLWQWDEGQHTARVTRVLPADRARGFLSPRIALDGRADHGIDHVGWWQGRGWSPVRDGGAR